MQLQIIIQVIEWGGGVHLTLFSFANTMSKNIHSILLKAHCSLGFDNLD